MKIFQLGGALCNSTKGERGGGDAVLAKSLSVVLVDAFSASYIVDAQESQSRPSIIAKCRAAKSDFDAVTYRRRRRFLVSHR